MIHSLWDPPAADSPELLRQSHQLMFRTLNDLRTRLPDILSNPGEYSGEVVMEAAIGRLTNPKLDPALKAGALTRLEQLMRTLDPTTPRRLYLMPADQASPIKMTVGDDLEALKALDAALDRSIVDTRPGKILRTSTPSPVDIDTALVAVGRLIVMLIVRLGQCDSSVLADLLGYLVAGRKVCLCGKWAWIDTACSPGRHRQRRRVFFDPTTLAAWLIARAHVPAIARPGVELKAGQQHRFRLRYLQNAFEAWQREAGLGGARDQFKKLEHLCSATRQRLHLVSVPILATYACGELVSSSLEPATWIRLIGGDPRRVASEPESETDDPATAEVRDDELGLEGLDPAAAPSFAEQLTAGELDDRGLISALRRALNEPRSTWSAALSQIAADLQSQAEPAETAILVVQWLRSLVLRRNKGKLLADGSIRHYRGLIVNRLLVLLPRSLRDIEASEIENAYTAVLDSRTSSGQAGKLAAALASFDRYVRTEAGLDLPRVDIPGFDAGGYDVSARIINEAEYQRGLDWVRDGDFVLPSQIASQRLIAFWGLAYRCGLRRTEVLGLRCRDVREDRLLIDEHEHRTLKTRNAYRLIPSSPIDADVLAAITALTRGRGGKDFLFFVETPQRKDFEAAPVIGHVKSLLKRVTGDTSVHAHNLRHSTASLTVLGVLADEARLKQHPWAETWMHDAQTPAKAIDQAISGRLHRYGGRANAIAMMLGHGSERTTFEHYVHVMDVLLFLTCWSGHFDQPANNPDRFLYPLHREAAQLLALLGLAPTTQVETKDSEALMRRIHGLARGAFVRIPRAEVSPTSHIADNTGTGAPVATKLSVQDLLATGSGDDRGRPAEQAELDTANLLLKTLTAAHQRAPEQLIAILNVWLSQQIANDDWASMTPANAKGWIEQCERLMPDVRIEARMVWKDAMRKTVKGPIFEVTSETKIGAAGRCWVRFADGRAKINRRTSKSGVGRSRSQGTITWVLQTFGRIHRG